MTLKSAIKRLEVEYDRAKLLHKTGTVHNPMAYALYQVWKMADSAKKDGANNDR